MQDIQLTRVRTIPHPKGRIQHVMKKSDPQFTGFGEIYCSRIHHGKIKGWKRHKKMTANLVVPVGAVRFVVHLPDQPEDSQFFQVILSEDDYQRLTIPCGHWFGFQGVGQGVNLILNMADMEHDPNEGEALDLGAFSFRWPEDE